MVHLWESATTFRLHGAGSHQHKLSFYYSLSSSLHERGQFERECFSVTSQLPRETCSLGPGDAISKDLLRDVISKQLVFIHVKLLFHSGFHTWQGSSMSVDLFQIIKNSLSTSLLGKIMDKSGKLEC